MAMLLKPIIVSAPFGNWISSEHATSTLGTYTLKNRGGLLYRLWRMALTMRYYWRSRSWINRLGLPNPGLGSLPFPTNESHYRDKIISIYGFNKDEWRELAFMAANSYHPMAVELNLSCPNVSHDVFLTDVMAAVDVLFEANVPMIAKLPPVRWMDLARPLYRYGISCFHGCNTIPSPGGGYSGKILKQYSLWCIDDLRQSFGQDACLIGGGGVTSTDDVLDYLKAGANHVAVGSMLFNPFRWKDIETLANVKLVPNPHFKEEN